MTCCEHKRQKVFCATFTNSLVTLFIVIVVFMLTSTFL